MEKKWRSYIFHPLFIGFIISSLVIYFFVKSFPQFSTEIKESYLLKNNGQIYFYDLDSDGTSEQLHYYKYDKVFDPTLYIYDSNNNLKYLTNFNEPPINNFALFVGDFNNDNIKEIFNFTNKSDSIFLYKINIASERETSQTRTFIAVVDDYNIETKINPIGLFDLNNDGSSEFLFYIDASYPLNPRKIFSFDIKKNNLITSPNLQASILKGVIVKDIDNDGSFEIIVPNMSVQVPGNGNISQIIVLDSNLDYKFEPVNFNGEKSKVTCGLIKKDDQWNIALLKSEYLNNKPSNTMFVIDDSGEKICEKEIQSKSNLSIIDWFENGQELLALSGNKLVVIDNNGEVSSEINLAKNKNVEYVTNVKLLNDKLDTYIFKNDSDLILLPYNRGKAIKIENLGKELSNLTVKMEQNENVLSIQYANRLHQIAFNENEAFVHSFLFQILVFIVIILTVYFISKIRSLRLKLREKNVKKTFYYKLLENNLIDNNNISKKDKDKDDAIIDRLRNNKQINNSKIHNDQVKTDGNLGLFDILEKVIDFYKEDIKIELHVSPNKENINLLPLVDLHVTKTCKQIIDFCADKEKINRLKVEFNFNEKFLNITFEIEAGANLFNQLKKKIEQNTLIERYNWDISYSKENDKINKIGITVPLSDSDDNTIKVIIAEDHDVSLFGLISLFKAQNEIEVIGTAKNGLEVLKILNQNTADVVITDISMPGMDGIELSEKLKNEFPGIKVIVFTMYMENWFIEQLVKNGVVGFVSKNSKIQELIGAVKHAYKGINYYCPQFKMKFGINTINQNTTDIKLDSLSKKEIQVLKLFAKNLQKEQIAKELDIPLQSLNDMIANILLKINAGNEDEIIRIAKHQKFISE